MHILNSKIKKSCLGRNKNQKKNIVKENKIISQKKKCNF
jgi:hypothetical protein